MKKIYVGRPVYLLGQGHEPEYHGRYAVIAYNRKNAEKKFLNYCMKHNPHTQKEMWRIRELQSFPKGKVSLEETIKILTRDTVTGIICLDEKS